MVKDYKRYAMLIAAYQRADKLAARLFDANNLKSIFADLLAHKIAVEMDFVQGEIKAYYRRLACGTRYERRQLVERLVKKYHDIEI